MSVAFFALLGCAIRLGIARLLRGLVFGLTSTSGPAAGVEEAASPGAADIGCEWKSSGEGYYFQNVLGCILMAIIARHKRSMNEHLAVGLASGLCGSLTTWATWMGEEAKTMLNGSPFEAFVSLLSMLCVSLCSYQFGHFVAGCGMGDEPACFDELCGLGTVFRLRRRRRRREPNEPLAAAGGAEAAKSAAAEEEDTSSSSETDSDDEDEEAGASSDAAPPSGRRSGAGLGVEGSGERAEGVDALDWGLRVDPSARLDESLPREIFLAPTFEVAVVIAALALVLLCLGLCLGLGYDVGLWDLAFAPFGALLRWWLSLYNASAQKACHRIPAMTLLANTLGCLCNALAAAYGADASMSESGQLALAALSTGFAGCLSTVSTFVSELRGDTLGGLRTRISYFLLSFGLAMAVLLPILSTAPCAV